MCRALYTPVLCFYRNLPGSQLVSHHKIPFKYGIFALICAATTTLYGNTAQYQFAFDSICKPHHSRAAVIPSFCHGRFGDTLLTFARTLYVAVKNNCEMLYTPFPYSDQLVMHDVFRHSSPELEAQFQNNINFNGNNQQAFLCVPVSQTLITVPYFSESLSYPLGGFYTDWEDAIFSQILKTVIAPRGQLNLITPPRNQISVALHVRTGGSFESWPEEAKHGSHLYKIPRFEFYTAQLKLLFELLDKQPLYVFLFTDDEHPEKLITRFKKAVRAPSISYEYRTENNHHNTNVLEDFFSIPNFDVLIRPDSSFSLMAEKIGELSIVISPGDFKEGLQVQAGSIKIRKSLTALRSKYLTA